VADKDSSLRNECCVAEHVVRMTVRGHDVAHGFVGAHTDSIKQTAALPRAPPAVDDSNGTIADDESAIGRVAFVGGRHQLDGADMKKNPRRNLVDVERFLDLLRSRKCSEGGKNGAGGEEPSFHRQKILIASEM
jgi:hypothetical protein